MNTVLISFVLASSFCAQGSAQGGEQDWSVADLLRFESTGSFGVSPDGRRAVWTKSVPDEESQRRKTHVWMSDLWDGSDIQLTRGEESCGSPKWSPDGSKIAFVTSRTAGEEEPDGSQLWLLSTKGGEAWKLTGGKRSVREFAWRDEARIVFVAQEEAAVYERERAEKKDTTDVVEDEANEPPVRLFEIDAASKKVTRLTSNRDRIDLFSMSPNGRYVATRNEQSLRYGYDQQIRPRCFVLDLETGVSVEFFKDRKLNLSGAWWTPDSKTLYAASDYTTHPKYVMASVTRLYTVDPGTGKETEVGLDWDRGLFFGDIAALNDGFLALLQDGCLPKLARYTRTPDGFRREWIGGDDEGFVQEIVAGRDGKTILYGASRPNVPPKTVRATLVGSTLENRFELAKVNAWLEDKPKAKGEPIVWKGALNEDVEGVLFYPHGYEAGKRYPLVLMIHGGPFGHDLAAWSDSSGSPVNLMCQRGALVLLPNYHGSSGYGLAFAESIAGGKYYSLPVEDIAKGVEHLISKGLVDADKLGVMGWSNGAILTTALIVHDQRYKAASSGAGGSEWIADWGSCAFGLSFSNYYLGKAPIEDPQLYIREAPLFSFDKVRTPTIFFHGTEDTSVPTHHGWEQFRTLQYLGRVDTKLVLFPGEGHGIGKLAHQRRKLEEELAWFDKYLFKAPEAKDFPEAVRSGSPLADALTLEKAARAGGRYGESAAGTLIPEVVKHGELEVGRFEVTGAQYAEFDRGFAVAAGRENHPANGVSFERAKAYCEWLSKKTGKVYRLPTEEEAEGLLSADSAQNTLDFWAGYPVNPDDAAKLQPVVAALGPKTLLRPVGSFPGEGSKGTHFDLGGNVAEWAIRKDGTGVALGGSADCPADARQKDPRPAREFIGFRVARGPGPAKKGG